MEEDVFEEQGRGIYNDDLCRCAADAYAETGKGFANYMMVLGMTETVALFVLGFSLTALPKLAGM